MKTMIVGYGNNSRRDDSVGWHVVEHLEAMALSDVDYHTAQQLEVELAATLAEYDAAIFIDAAVPESPETIQRSVVEPCFESHAVAHYLTPAVVLSLCRMLYNHELSGVLFSIRGRDFNFGTTLSTEVEEAARVVVREIAELVTRGSLANGRGLQMLSLSRE